MLVPFVSRPIIIQYAIICIFVSIIQQLLFSPAYIYSVSLLLAVTYSHIYFPSLYIVETFVVVSWKLVEILLSGGYFLIIEYLIC